MARNGGRFDLIIHLLQKPGILGGHDETTTKADHFETPPTV